MAASYGFANGFANQLSTTTYDVEDSLVQRAVQGDKGAFSCLYDTNVLRVYKHIAYRLYDKTEAEDITQEVFVRAWNAIGRYHVTGAPFFAWLVKIADNLTCNCLKRGKRVIPLDKAPECVDEKACLEEQTDLVLTQERVHRAVSSLKGIQQRVITMRFVDEMEYSEIAIAINKSEGAVRVIQHRALTELRKLLVPAG